MLCSPKRTDCMRKRSDSDGPALAASMSRSSNVLFIHLLHLAIKNVRGIYTWPRSVTLPKLMCAGAWIVASTARTATLTFEPSRLSFRSAGPIVNRPIRPSAGLR